MTLPETMYAWAPMDRPDMLVFLPKGHLPPKNETAFFFCARDTLRYIISESNEGEIRNANNQLRDFLPDEMTMFLPSGILKHPDTPGFLYFSPKVYDSAIGEWKSSIAEALSLPPMPADELAELVDQIWLESYISPLIA